MPNILTRIRYLISMHIHSPPTTFIPMYRSDNSHVAKISWEYVRVYSEDTVTGATVYAVAAEVQPQRYSNVL